MDRRAATAQSHPIRSNLRLVVSTGKRFIRFYDPPPGRFVNEDPMAGSLMNPQSLNPYACAQNNPVNRVDPTGRYSETATANPLRTFPNYLGLLLSIIAIVALGAFGPYGHLVSVSPRHVGASDITSAGDSVLVLSAGGARCVRRYLSGWAARRRRSYGHNRTC